MNDDLEQLEMRRKTNKYLEKAGMCMPGASLIYMVTQRDIEDFERIKSDFRMTVGGESNVLFEEINRLVLHRLVLRVFLLLFALTILSYLAMLRPGVLTILMSRVVPAFAMLYILREIIIGGSRINAKLKAIEHDRLKLIKRLNIARTKLPVVPQADANEIMNKASDTLNRICFWFAAPDNVLCNLETWMPCSITIIAVVLRWYLFICFGECNSIDLLGSIFC